MVFQVSIGHVFIDKNQMILVHHNTLQGLPNLHGEPSEEAQSDEQCKINTLVLQKINIFFILQKI